MGAPLEQRAERMLELLDAMDLDGLGAMLSDDAQSIDEISRGWMRGRADVERYMSQLKDTVSGVQSQMMDVHERVWGDVGLVTFVLDQTYMMDGQRHAITAPTSLVFRHEDDDWKIALIHTVPIPDQG